MVSMFDLIISIIWIFSYLCCYFLFLSLTCVLKAVLSSVFTYILVHTVSEEWNMFKMLQCWKIFMQTRLCELFSVVFCNKPSQNILILFDYGFPFAIPADNLYSLLNIGIGTVVMRYWNAFNSRHIQWWSSLGIVV